VSDVLNSLAVLLQARGDLAEAEPVFRESLAMYKRLSSEEYPKVAMALNDLASLLAARGDLAGAEPLYREALEMRRRLVGKEHPDTVAAVISMGGLRVAQGNYIEALKILAPTEGEARKAFSGGHAWQLGRLLMHLGKARAGLAKTGAEFAAAEANQLEAYANFVKAPGLFPQDTRDSVQALVDFYVAWDKAEPGKGHDAKAAEWRAKLPKEKSKDRQ
jgi:tetratricopeptide (TPR) repeat protein